MVNTENETLQTTTQSTSLPEECTYEAVLFDADGVIIELTDWDVLRSAIKQTYLDFGIEPTDADIDALISVQQNDLVSLCKQHDIEPEEFWYARDRNAADVQCQEIVAGRKGLYEDVEVLNSIDLPCGLVSNNQHWTIEFVIEHFKLDRTFRTWYGREPTIDGIQRKKPNAYYIKKAINDLDISAAIYIGDSEVDIQAAERAGIDSVFVRREHRCGYEFETQATYEVSGLAELPGLLGF